MDKLHQSAIAFNNLLNKSYTIIAGSKGKKITINLNFKKEHYFHLIGLHKLVDIDVWGADKDKSDIFDEIYHGKITDDCINKSSFYDEIYERVLYFEQIEQILDSNDIVIRFNKAMARSRIPAKYLVSFHSDVKYFHIFIDENNNEEFCHLKSFFIRSDTQYIDRQKKFKVLKKVKHNMTDNTFIVLYNKLDKQND